MFGLPKLSALISVATLVVLVLVVNTEANANPAFARQYSASCAMCHAAFPKLNSFGEAFLAGNIRMDDWKEKVGVPTGDDSLLLPKIPPVAFRVQAYAQARQNDSRGAAGIQGADGNANFDFQSPYLIKMLSTAPLSDQASYYFTAIMAEKGQNGQMVVDDAWLSYTNIFGSGVGMMFGQWQVADLMFPRETRLTVQDFIPYRMASLTYERGILLDRDMGPVTLSVGIANGNGTGNSNLPLNSAGFQRPDRSFDNNTRKNVLAHAAFDVGPVSAGALILGGDQNNAAGTAKTSKRVYGVNVSTKKDDRLFVFGQFIWNQWDDFINVDTTYKWTAGFAGVDYVYDSRWVFSGLYSYADAGDLDGTPYFGATSYDGLNLNIVTGTVSYYFMRNFKGVVEANYDFQAVGGAHLTKENTLLVGFDAAF